MRRGRAVFAVGVLALAVVIIFARRQTTPLPPLPTCGDAERRAALDALPPYQPSGDGSFVRVRDRSLVIDDQPLLLRGVNYYPLRYPWRRFLLESDLDSVTTELDLLQAAGFNALRIFLWNDALFQCFGSGAVPQSDVFSRLDDIIKAAAERGFRLIVTLNDLPDLEAYPLYTNPAHTQAQTEFIVARYREEPALLAWDVRNEGDIDYGSNNPLNARFSRDEVIAWLAQTSAQVRTLDPNHLITAGWFTDQEATIPYVDFVSFHHWSDAASLLDRIAMTRAATEKPILLEEFGYSTQRMSEDDQARTIAEIVHFADREGLAGWLIWTAFDFATDRTCYPSPCLSPDNGEHYFGLWRLDYAPKPALASLIEN